MYSDPKNLASTYGVRGTCRCRTNDVTECRDQGGCDEFWAEVWEAKRRRETPRSYKASAKQIGFMKSLVATKQLTDEKLIARLAEIDALLAKGEDINGVLVSKVINHAKTCADKVVAPNATAVTNDVEAPTAKQIGFMSSLLKRKVVSDELLAQVEEAKSDKRKASKLIDALTKCADKEKEVA